MAEIAICGGSVIGSLAAVMLARDGHHITVLEADAAPVPDDPARAWERWERKGVAQFHQPHNLFSRARAVADEDAPGLTEQLLAAGGTWINPIAPMPPFITDTSPRPDDDRFRFVNARRPVIEAVYAHAAAGHDNVDVRRGVKVRGLLTADSTVDGAPHVVGVALDDGSEHRADLVVDAMGRRSKMVDWLAALGGPAPYVESTDAGFVYYTMFFRGDEHPNVIGPPVVDFGTISVLTLVSDNNTWSLTIWGRSDDTELRALRDPEVFKRVLAASPMHAHLLAGEELTGVETMAGILDKYRRYVVDDRPVVTGALAVGDAWACTNPSAGRGISVGHVHAQRLRDAVRDSVDDPVALALRFDELTERDVTPFYRNQIEMDRRRLAAMEALRRGDEPPPPDPTMQAFMTALLYDADVFRGAIESITCLALPQDVFARPGFMEKIERHASAPAMQLPGPDRAQLLDLIGRP